MRAYSETYVTGAQRRMGAMFDFAVAGCGVALAGFYEAFLVSDVAARFGSGDPAIVAGRSGEELALEVIGAAGLGAAPLELTPWRWKPAQMASEVYWAGWALAFYQWASAASFSEIQRMVPIERVMELYRPYHEMDVRQFCDRMDRLVDEALPFTKLKGRRMAAGLSQSQLADATGVPVRTLQQYEQRQKDLNRARADYVDALARALCCAPSDILERRAGVGIEYAAVRL